MQIYVFYQDSIVGSIEKTQGQWSFQYDPSWLADNNAFAISLNLPLGDKKFGHFEAHSFFANLLPESEIRDQIARSLGVSEKNDFEILKEIGGECAGALCIFKEKEAASQKGSYKQISEKQLKEFIGKSGSNPIIHATDNLRLSLAGAQQKLPVFKKSKQYFLPMGSFASTHILKPQCSKFKGLIENEYFCMRLAKAVGLPTAHTELFYVDEVAVLEIERYDRVLTGKNVGRLHQEDLCQALGLSYDQKYETEGGASLEQCFAVVERHSAQPILDKRSLLQWVLFNYIIGNADAHAKNISLVYKNRQIFLAPFYDLISTIIYNGLTENMAMKIGKEKRLGQLKEKHLEELALTANIKKQFVVSEFNKMNQQLKQQSLILEKEMSGKIKDPEVVSRICQYISGHGIKKKLKL